MLKPKRFPNVEKNRIYKQQQEEKRRKMVVDGKYGIMSLDDSNITGEQMTNIISAKIKTGGKMLIRLFPYTYNRYKLVWEDANKTISEGQVLFEFMSSDLDKCIEAFNIIKDILSFDIALVDRDLNIIRKTQTMKFDGNLDLTKKVDEYDGYNLGPLFKLPDNEYSYEMLEDTLDTAGITVPLVDDVKLIRKRDNNEKR